MENFKEHIARCFELIERKLSIGSRDTWDTNDFKLLSKSIQESTGTLLSVSTLKRLSGKVYYSSKPNSTTLNALANYIGFEDWRNFQKLENGKIDVLNPSTAKKRTFGERKLLFLITVALLIISVIFVLNRKTEPPSPRDFSFSSRPVSKGIPNSVIFEYDASTADPISKIEIQQDWDDQKRITVSKQDSIATSIYYRPGFFQSKLVVDGSIIKENDVFIPSDDWLGTIEWDSLPIYLKTEDINFKGKLAITPEMVAEYNLDPSTSQIAAGFYQVRDFGDLYMDDFEMSTSIKNDFKKGISVCQRAQIMILYPGGMLSAVFGNKGCASELSLFAFNEMIDGKKTDLSGFGVDFKDYAQIKCVSKNQKLDIFVNDVLAYRLDVPTSENKIIGIAYFFEGAGSIKDLEFKNSNEVFYSSNFE